MQKNPLQIVTEVIADKITQKVTCLESYEKYPQLQKLGKNSLNLNLNLFSDLSDRNKKNNLLSHCY